MLTGFAASEIPTRNQRGCRALAQASGQILHGRCATSCRPPVQSGPLAVADYDGDSDLICSSVKIRLRDLSATATSRLFHQQEWPLLLTMAINHSSIRSDRQRSSLERF